MSEIRLICPGCGAEYRLPHDAIPPAGREVECSACGHVWTATAPAPGPRLDLGGFAAPDATAPAAAPDAAPDAATARPEDTQPLPAPSRRLPPNVLNILREEVEHERRLRAAEAAGRPGTVAAAPVAPASAGADADWPATTVTLPAGTARAVIAAPQPQPPQLDLAAEPAPPDSLQRVRLKPAPAEQNSLIRPGAPQSGSPQSGSPQAGTLQPEGPQVIRHPSPPVRARQRNGAYRTGFGLAVMVAASCAALYLLAPGLAANDSAFGRHLLELRQEVDRGRLWLQDQARDLTG